MAGKIVLDTAELESTVGVYTKAINTDFLDLISSVGQKMASLDDNNGVKDAQMDNFRKYEKQYNDMLDSANNILEIVKDYYDVAEFLAKGGKVGEVSDRDASFKTEKVDTGSIMA